MSRELKRLIVYMVYVMIVSFPSYGRYLFLFISGRNIEYANLVSETCILNVAICAYTIVIFLNTGLKRNVFFHCCYMLATLNIIIASIIYNIFSDNIFVLERTKEYRDVYQILILLILINVIFTAVVQIYIPENKGKNSNFENTYEDYLLKKIDLKQQSNENLREEVKSNKDVQDSQPDTDILSEILKNENEIIEHFKGSKPEPDTDIFAEMFKNYHETREYFKISKFQSKFSFFVSVFSAIAGFIILAVAIYGIIDKEHLEVSIIAAVSGAITEIASVVVLGIHNKSALQLNYYYDALHENEKLLSAINMADKLNADKREEMYIEIIRKQIEQRKKY